MLVDKDINYQKLKKTIRTAVHFLDNTIDANKYLIKSIEEITKGNRKIGLGVMGFADALIKLGIPYNSNKAVSFAERLMKFFSREGIQASVELAKKRGSFPNFKGSIWEKRGYDAMRNATITTIAPTGTISIIAGTTSGIEPLFAVSFVRNVMEGTKLLEVNPLFEEAAKKRGIHSKELMMEIAKTGSVEDVDGVPEDLKHLFVTAFDITPEWHVRIQAAFQKHTDNAVSKTINFAHDGTVDDVKKTFILAYKFGCKGITVYRYGSKREQVLYVGSVLGRERGETLEYTSADSEYSGGCPTPLCD
jgi:ribonucleoside-diphosphate reductase alpha chain